MTTCVPPRIKAKFRIYREDAADVVAYAVDKWRNPETDAEQDEHEQRVRDGFIDIQPVPGEPDCLYFVAWNVHNIPVSTGDDNE